MPLLYQVQELFQFLLNSYVPLKIIFLIIIDYIFSHYLIFIYKSTKYERIGVIIEIYDVIFSS